MEALLVWEILVVLLLITANGFLSGAEIAVISADRGKLRAWQDAGDPRARLALDLAQNPNKFLPAVQVALAFVGTFAAVLAGAAIVEEIESRLIQSPLALVAHGRSEIAIAAVALGLSLAAG